MLATHAAVRADHGAHSLQALPAAAAELEVLPGGCGWFDSSLDLSRGLAVVEHAGFDAIGDTVPLAWQLAPWL